MKNGKKEHCLGIKGRNLEVAAMAECRAYADLREAESRWNRLARDLASLVISDYRAGAVEILLKDGRILEETVNAALYAQACLDVAIREYQRTREYLEELKSMAEA